MWLGLSTFPGFEYWFDWYRLGKEEAAEIIQAHKAMASLDYFPPMLAEHEWGTPDTKRLGKVLSVVEWTGQVGKLPTRTWLMGLVQWTPAAWQAILDGEIEYISPHYGPQTDSQGNWWDFTLLEVSAAAIPLQKQIQSVQTWAKVSGAALSGRKPMMTQQQWNKVLASNPDLVAFKAAMEGTMEGITTRASAAAADDEAMSQVLQDMSALGQRLNELLGMVAQNRARLDMLEAGGVEEEGPEAMDDMEDGDALDPDETDPQASDSEDEEAQAGDDAEAPEGGDEEGEPKKKAAATIQSLTATLALTQDLAGMGADLVLPITAKDANWMATLPLSTQKALKARLVTSKGVKATAPDTPTDTPLKGRRTRAGQPPKQTPRKPQDKEDPSALRKRLSREARGEAARLTALGTPTRSAVLYRAKLKEAGLIAD